MPLYTFYACKADGISTSLQAKELASDDYVVENAMRLLDEHPSAAYVAAFEGDRPIVTRYRMNAGLRELLSRRPSVSRACNNKSGVRGCVL